MAAVDYFLKIDGIKGESQDGKHKDEIEISSFSWGAAQQGTSAGGSGGGAGKVSMQDMHFTTTVSTASATLMLYCANGKHIPKALLTCRKAGETQQEFLKIHLTDLLVSSYQTGGSAGGSLVPTEQFSINFSKIEMEYAPQNKDGSLAAALKSGWDLKLNQKV